MEITHEEVRGIDINQVASMQLKDGTVVVVKGEGELEGAEGENYQEGEFAQEEFAQEEANQYAEGTGEEQSNQLRARPMMVARPVGYHFPKPVLARPGMPKVVPPPRHNPYVQPPRPVVPVVGPRPVPVVKPVIPGKPYAYPLQPKPMVVPMGKPGPKPLVNQMIQANAFRSRPANVEEEENFQEEEYAGEEQYCECDEQGQEEYGEQQLRARPMVVPVRTGAPIVNPRIPSLIPHHYHRPKPHVPVFVPVGPKRGPLAPVGYNTFQPRVFRARPGYSPMVRPVVSPMFTPVTTFQPIRHGVKPHPHPHLHPRPVRPVPGRIVPMGGVFRNRPRSSSYDGQECAEECVDQNNQTCICSKCGKYFSFQ